MFYIECTVYKFLLVACLITLHAPVLKYLGSADITNITQYNRDDNHMFYIVDNKWGKFLNAYSDLDLDPMKLNIELVRVIFIYYNVFRFRVPRSISF